jgi:hypothetical protein
LFLLSSGIHHVICCVQILVIACHHRFLGRAFRHVWFNLLVLNRGFFLLTTVILVFFFVPALIIVIILPMSLPQFLVAWCLVCSLGAAIVLPVLRYFLAVDFQANFLVLLATFVFLLLKTLEEFVVP